jgi:peptidoglycan/xylan/chitin deacetylase (PgdA/CDA1 family)/folate-dependent phosphoribosylglycinamide formyltransferase PurN
MIRDDAGARHSGKAPRVMLAAGDDSPFLAELVTRLKALRGIEFDELILTVPCRGGSGNRRESGGSSVWKSPDSSAGSVRGFLRRRFESFLLAPEAGESLQTLTRRLGIRLHESEDLFSNEVAGRIQKNCCDLLLMIGPGRLSDEAMRIPRLGVYRLHQSDLGLFRAGDPGFWELWHEKGLSEVAVHRLWAPKNEVELIARQEVPIFPYDTLDTLQDKLNEISLRIFPEIIQKIAEGKRIPVIEEANKREVRPAPSIMEKVKLVTRLKRKQFNLIKMLRIGAKNAYFCLVLLFIYARDFYFQKIRNKNILTVLYYHRITSLCQDGMTSSIREFEWQIRFLKKWYSLVSPLELEDWLSDDPKIRGKKGVLLTFDDGYADNYFNALPILRKYHCPAIFFVSTGFVGNDRQFDHDKILQPRLTFEKMSWAQLRELDSSQVEVGVHSDSHVSLGKIPVDEAIREIEISVDKYRENLNRSPVLMSFPFGKKCDISKELLEYLKSERKFRMAFSAYGNKNISPVDRWNINRINIGAGNTGLIYWYKVAGEARTLVRPYEKCI